MGCVWKRDRHGAVFPLMPRGRSRACSLASPQGHPKTPNEDPIRQRAHELWEENYRPDGRDEEFWHQAERELAIASADADQGKKAAHA
jgi:hypothetical protein